MNSRRIVSIILLFGFFVNSSSLVGMNFKPRFIYSEKAKRREPKFKINSEAVEWAKKEFNRKYLYEAMNISVVGENLVFEYLVKNQLNRKLEEVRSKFLKGVEKFNLSAPEKLELWGVYVAPDIKEIYTENINNIFSIYFGELQKQIQDISLEISSEVNTEYKEEYMYWFLYGDIASPFMMVRYAFEDLNEINKEYCIAERFKSLENKFSKWKGKVSELIKKVDKIKPKGAPKPIDLKDFSSIDALQKELSVLAEKRFKQAKTFTELWQERALVIWWVMLSGEKLINSNDNISIDDVLKSWKKYAERTFLKDALHELYKKVLPEVQKSLQDYKQELSKLKRRKTKFEKNEIKGFKDNITDLYLKTSRLITNLYRGERMDGYESFGLGIRSKRIDLEADFEKAEKEVEELLEKWKP